MHRGVGDGGRDGCRRPPFASWRSHVLHPHPHARPLPRCAACTAWAYRPLLQAKAKILVVKDVEREDIEFISKASREAERACAACLYTACLLAFLRDAKDISGSTDPAAVQRGRVLSDPVPSLGLALLALRCRRCTACPSHTWTTCGRRSWATPRWWRRST